MCRSKADGGRRCAGRKNLLTLNKDTTAVTIPFSPNQPDTKPSPALPTYNRLLTVSDEEWFNTPWAERKKMVEEAFYEAREAVGSDASWGGWSSATRALGTTHQQLNRATGEVRSTIRISNLSNRACSAVTMADTLAHELAHAKSSYYAAHGKEWENNFAAVKDTLGLNTETVSAHKLSDVERAEHERLVAVKKATPPAWIGVCPQGHRFGAGRKSKYSHVCVKCSRNGYPQTEAIITYTRNTNKETV